MTHLDRLRQNLKNSLLKTGTRPGTFAAAAGISLTTIRYILTVNYCGRPYRRTVERIEAEMRRRGWLLPVEDAGALADQLPADTDQVHDKTDGTPIEILKLSPRVYNALVRERINTVEQLRTVEHPGLLRGIAAKGVQEIQAVLQQFPAPETAPAPQEPPADPSFDLPYNEIAEDDPKIYEKLIVNMATEAIAKNPDGDPKKKEKIERMIKENEDMIAAPEGYYPWSYVYNANPINKLSQEEKLHCIRTLPLPIVNKLFPHL